ncbi:unnamed protein product [Camellia sinensis]
MELRKDYQGVLAAKSSSSVEECYWLKHEEVVAIENELSTRKNVVDNVKVALESLPYADRQMAILQKGSTESRLKGLVASRGKVGKGNAEVALSWVAYDEELKCYGICIWMAYGAPLSLLVGT